MFVVHGLKSLQVTAFYSSLKVCQQIHRKIMGCTALLWKFK